MEFCGRSRELRGKNTGFSRKDMEFLGFGEHFPSPRVVLEVDGVVAPSFSESFFREKSRIQDFDLEIPQKKGEILNLVGKNLWNPHGNGKSQKNHWEKGENSRFRPGIVPGAISNLFPREGL